VSDIRDCQAQIDALLVAPRGESGEEAPPPLCAPLSGLNGDEELVRRAMDARNGGKFSRLWYGDTSDYDGDDSRADLALCTILAWWCDGDRGQVDRLFRASSLYRDKWGREDYSSATLDKAIAKAAENPRTHTGMDAKAAPTARPWEDRSDSGNAAVFVRLMGARVRHVAVWGAWVVYDGRRWTRDATHLAESLMSEALLTRFDEAKQAASDGDDDAATKMSAWAANSRAAAKQAAALQVARSDRRVVARPEDFDRDPYLFNVQNGTLELRTGKLRPHDPADLITKLAPVAYDPAARSDLWERVLAEATDADEALQGMLQRVAGYALTGDAGEEVFFIFYGPEATMKTTFAEALASTLGDYSQGAEAEAFLSRSHVGGPRDDIAGMEGVRFLVVSEFDRGRKMAEALLKQLTGGDRVRARHLYQTAREFRFTAKLAFHTNHMPAMSDDDGAVWRRAWIVPFTHTIPEEKRDPTVKARLCDPQVSGAAILAWAVRGCLEWQRRGLGKPPAVANATQAVRLSMDPLADFLSDNCIAEPGAWTASTALRSAYEQWAKDNRRKPVGLSEWGTRLNARGFEASRHGHKRDRGWLGVRMVDDDAGITALALEDGCETDGIEP